MAPAPALLRRPDEPKQPAFLELFFDLVYVFALTQLTELVIANLNWRGLFEAILLLMALWWIWGLTAWLTDSFNPQHPAVQLHVILVMLGVLLMGIVIPEAFGSYGLVFAVLYLVINFGRVAFVRIGGRRTDLAGSATRAGIWFTGSGVFWIAGAFSHGTARGALWLTALSIDQLAAALRWPVPGVGRSTPSDLSISETHLAERYRQLFIVALGEIVLTLGLTFVSTGTGDLTFERTTVLILSFVSTALAWRLYIYRAGSQLAPAIAKAKNPFRLNQWSSISHSVMVAGILLTAVGFSLIIREPDKDIPLSWIAGIAGGPALFLAGRSAFEYVIFGRITWPRPIGIILLSGIAVAVTRLRPELTSGAATLVLALVAALDARRGRRRPTEQPAPTL